jgi:hypothetical protein
MISILNAQKNSVAQDPWYIEPTDSRNPVKRENKAAMSAGLNVQKTTQRNAIDLSDSDLDI